MRINILATYKELDITGYYMLEQLSQNPFFNIYIAVTSDKTENIKGKCTPLPIPEIHSKFDRQVIKQIRAYIKQYHINVIYSCSSSGLSNSLFASIGTKARNIGYRGTQAKIRKFDFTYYLGILNPRVAHIVCETEDIRNYLSNEFIHPDKLSAVLKPYNTQWVEHACRFPKQIKGLPDNVTTCVYIGCCKNRPFKGLSCLIQAFHQIQDPTIHLLFIGDYDQSDFNLAESGPAHARIHFLGLKNDAINYLPSQDIFILPSLRDASPRVIREAMACGLPCIVSDIPGARDLIINGKTGLLFPAGSSGILASTIQQLANNKERRRKMGEAGKERIINSFNVNDYVQYYETLFARIAAKR